MATGDDLELGATNTATNTTHLEAQVSFAQGLLLTDSGTGSATNPVIGVDGPCGRGCQHASRWRAWCIQRTTGDRRSGRMFGGHRCQRRCKRRHGCRGRIDQRIWSERILLDQRRSQWILDQRPRDSVGGLDGRGIGVHGRSNRGAGVFGESTRATGVSAEGDWGVFANGERIGVYGVGSGGAGIGVLGIGPSIGVWAGYLSWAWPAASMVTT